MFGIGLQELILIVVVALIVLGPHRLPEVAKSLGKFYREVKGSLDEVKSSISQDISNIKDIQKESILKQETQKDNRKTTFEEEFESEIRRRSPPRDELKREKVSFTKENKSSEVQS
ncbi:MAG: Sec-independent protein translocase protein TatB [Hydrogenothermaceae bacterium]|nr:Sec-independent protein translocase protein TatB [Hydrogenothermaceae bacterium]